MTNKIDRRKKYVLVLDVETAGNIGNPMVYDLGFAICDKKGNIYHQESFVISEIFDCEKLMNTAYYACKIPMYLERLENGYHKKVTFLAALMEMERIVKEYNVQTVSAYNLAFDLRAIKCTGEKLLGKGPTFANYEKLCIWSLACEVLFTQKSFPKVAVAEGWLSDAGNYRTSAEIAYRYITKEYQFEEEHTGLEDVKIECEILAKCYAQKKKHESGILSHPWRIVKNYHAE